MSGLYLGLFIRCFGFCMFLMRMKMAMMDGTAVNVKVARKLLCVVFMYVIVVREFIILLSVVID